MPVLGYLQMRWAVGLDDSMRANCLCHCGDGVVLHVAGLDMLWIAWNERHILALFVLQADLPTGEKFWSRLYVIKPWILERSLELTTHNIFKTVVRNDVVVSALIFD